MYESYAKIRDSKGLKDYNVSAGTGISPGTLSDWKSGKYAPKVDKLQKIADFLGVSLDYLMTGQDAEKESDSGKKYYFNDETAAMAQALYENSDLRMLFDASKDSRPEDLRMAADMLKRFKETNPNG